MDLQTREDLNRIAEFLDMNKLGERPADVGDGLWKPTPIQVLLGEVRLVDIMYAREQRKHEGIVGVVGSGDGRRAFMLNRLGYDVHAYELVPELVEFTRYAIKALADKGLIDQRRIDVVKGDFLEQGTYGKGPQFEDFPRIFAYLRNSNTAKLVAKIAKDSAKGTELLSLRHIEWDTQGGGLKHVKSGTVMAQGHTYYALDRYVKL